MIAYKSLLGHYTSERFTPFIQDKLMPELEYLRTFIMDNASWHHSKLTKDLLERQGHRIIFQPPYTPQFNLCGCTSLLIKPRISRQERRSYGILQDLIPHVCESIDALTKAPFLNEIKCAKQAQIERPLGHLN